MSLQSSTFNTAHVLDNEIVKATDFEFAFEKIAENVSRATQMILESNQDFVINGKVTPYQGMNVQIAPIYGVCKSTGIPFGRTESDVMEYGFAESENGRVDIIEVHGEWETYDEQQRAFNDPDTDVKTYQYVDTKKLMRPVFKIKTGVEGSSVAPEVDDGYVKLAEVVIRANNSTITAADIKNITADIAGIDNEGWTTEPDITYNIGYISDVNERFRVQHNEDGTHKDNVIDTDSLSIGTGTKQVNGNVLPVGGVVSIPGETIVATDSILSVLVKSAAIISSLYEAYIKYGTYGFNGELSISALADANNNLTKALKISADGTGNATIKIDNTTVLTIDSNGKLSTNGYTATSDNNIVTKKVTDAISTSLTSVTARVTALENAITSTNEYSNAALSMGTNGRYNYETAVRLATTTNIELAGIPIIDGVATANGDVVLVKEQTEATENGVYTVNSSGSWSRVDGYNTPNKIKGKIFFVSEGTANGSRMFYVPKVDFTDGSAYGSDDIPVLEYMATTRGKANRLIMRDANGRAQVAAPSAENDIARKAEVTALYGNTVGTALETNGSVGTATTFARSDHVHPIPYCIHTSSDSSAWFVFTKYNTCSDQRYYMDVSDCCAGTSRYGIRVAYANSAGSATTATSATNATNACKSYCVMDYYSNTTPLYIGYACAGLTCEQITHLAAFSTNYSSGKIVIKDASKANVQSWLGLGSAAYTASTAYRASDWLPTALGGIAINPGACSNWSEGIRFNLANNGWSTVTFGGAANSTCGCANVFSIHVNCTAPKKFYVAYQGSTVNSYFEPDNNTSAVLWHGNVTGNLYGCACCAGRDGSGCAFGTAARCAATAFLGATAKACCAAWANLAYCVPTNCSGVYATVCVVY